MTFSCIIPAYNEGPRIQKVLDIVLACPEIDEVIVVNDGSTDHTQEAIESIQHDKLQVIKLDTNVGKTKAIFCGIETSTGTHIVSIDADLLHLTPEHITSLISPVRDGVVDMTFSIRENSLGIYKWLGTDFVTGERVIPRAVYADRGYYTKGPGFGLEVKMNQKIIEGKYTFKNIRLSGVITPRKAYKCGYIKGTISDIKMIRDILSVMPIWKLLYQLWYFSRHDKV